MATIVRTDPITIKVGRIPGSFIGGSKPVYRALSDQLPKAKSESSISAGAAAQNLAFRWFLGGSTNAYTEGAPDVLVKPVGKNRYVATLALKEAV